MIDSLRFALTLASALGCGLIAGVFFGFSSFVMKALARIPPPQGIAAMQSINVVVLNPVFLGVFVGTAAASLALALSALLGWRRPDAGYLLAGSLLYVVGCFLVTMVCNVPRNDALAALDPAKVESAAYWTGYVSSWTFWNHVRTLGALGGLLAFILALYRSAAAR